MGQIHLMSRSLAQETLGTDMENVHRHSLWIKQGCGGAERLLEAKARERLLSDGGN